VKHLIAALVVFAMAAGVAEATPVPFEDVVPLNEHISMWETLCYQHDITDDVPAGYEVTEATLSVQLTDDQGRWEWLIPEWSLVLAEGGTWTMGCPEVGDVEINVAALDDGLLNVSITSLVGDFIAVDSTLAGSAAPVPEPATLALFAMGGIATAATRLRKKK